jgi:hypothetical protein
MSVITKKSHQGTVNFNISPTEEVEHLQQTQKQRSRTSSISNETKSMVYIDPQTGFQKVYRIPNLSLNKQTRLKSILKSQRNKNLPILRVGFQLLTKVTADYQSGKTRGLHHPLFEKLEMEPDSAKDCKSDSFPKTIDLVLKAKYRRPSYISVSTNSNNGDRNYNQNSRRLSKLSNHIDKTPKNGFHTNSNLRINTEQQFNDRKPSEHVKTVLQSVIMEQQFNDRKPSEHVKTVLQSVIMEQQFNDRKPYRIVKTAPEMKKAQTADNNEGLYDNGPKARLSLTRRKNISTAPDMDRNATSKMLLLEERR